MDDNSGFLQNNNLANQKFYNAEELSNLGQSINNNDVDLFNAFIEKLMCDNLVNKYIYDNGLTIDIEKFRKKFIEVILCTYYEEFPNRVRFIEVLIEKYNFIFEDSMINDIIQLCESIDTLEILNKYYDLGKYMSSVSGLFINMCCYTTLEEIKRFFDFNLDITKINYKTDKCNALFGSLRNSDTNVLKFLLEQNIDFKKYESILLNDCIVNRRHDHLKILVDYGVDLNAMADTKITLTEKDISIYKLLHENNIDPLIILSLFLERPY